MYGFGAYGEFAYAEIPQVLSDPGSPAVLLQAFVEFGGKTDEGRLIETVLPAWDAIISILRRDPGEMYSIPPDKWEELIAAAYDRAGFDRVTLTPRSGDFGRDVIAQKSGRWAIRFLDQVKAYKPGHVVTAEEVRALGFVLQRDERANKGIVTTTSAFAPLILKDPYIGPLVPTRMELIDGKQLIEHLASLLKR